MKKQAKKPKIEPGQCYEENDHVYMIVGPLCANSKRFWIVENTLTKDRSFAWNSSHILTLRRLFGNNG